MDYVDAPGDASTTGSSTCLDPRAVASATSPDAAFAVGLRVACRHVVGWGAGEQADECTVWLADPVTGSWASADYEPHAAAYRVEEYGPRRRGERSKLPGTGGTGSAAPPAPGTASPPTPADAPRSGWTPPAASSPTAAPARKAA